MRQFASHPLTTYELNGKQFLFNNFFIHFALREVLKDNQNFIETYDLGVEERPDVVAEKVYGDSDLAWLVLMVNDIVDPTQEWVHNTTQFQNYLNEKYENATELYSTSYKLFNNNVADFEATGILNNNKSPFGTKLSKTDHEATDITKYQDITNAYAEDMLNESLRTIKLIKKEYVDAVLSEITRKLSEAK